MNTLQFISSLVNSLAWPGAAIGIAFIFRKPFAQVLSSRSVKTLKAGPQGLEVEFFDEKLAEARTQLEEVGAPGGPGSTAPETGAPGGPAPTAPEADPDFIAEMQQLAEVAPSAVVMQSFTRLEQALVDAIANAEGHPVPRFWTLGNLTRRAVALGLLSEFERGAVDDLAVLRNYMAHGGTIDLDKGRALQYADLIGQLISSLTRQAISE